jgi:predicted GNAT family N-acyltransferase
MRCIKVVNDEQLKQAFDIRLEVFVKEQGVPDELEMDEFDETPHSCNHFLILQEDKPVATGRWREYEAGIAKVQRIAVLKPYRNLGIGKLLLEGMEKDIKRSGYTTTLLDSQCTAEPFYIKLGYITESVEPFLDADIPHVRMRKLL